MLAALNHPNIARIHGVDETDAVRALVLELVEGPTLAERLGARTNTDRRGNRCRAANVAALEAAHEQGIVHRDLKPANVKLRPDGTSRCWISAWPRSKPRVTLPALRPSPDNHEPGPDPPRRDPRHRGLHEPGAGRGREAIAEATSGRSARPLRDAVRPAGVQRRRRVGQLAAVLLASMDWSGFPPRRRTAPAAAGSLPRSRYGATAARHRRGTHSARRSDRWNGHTPRHPIVDDWPTRVQESPQPSAAAVPGDRRHR